MTYGSLYYELLSFMLISDIFAKLSIFLSFRNCILTDNGRVIKIADLAKGNAAYNNDYSEVRGRQGEPIRWQAWETILLVNELL